jgi:hypothetical protein
MSGISDIHFSLHVFFCDFLRRCFRTGTSNGFIHASQVQISLGKSDFDFFLPKKLVDFLVKLASYRQPVIGVPNPYAKLEVEGAFAKG